MCSFDFTDSKNIGKDYNGFELLLVENLPDYDTKAVYLRHKKTGLEVYHILADDDENLFSFGFRTLSRNSKGTAHIMEHSVLCGSEKYPLKEPFATLENRSVKTYLNAFTYSDKTAYPAASLIRSDYFNIMDVYADAVFFPLLSKETFLQEGHRLEIDDDGKLSVQGVVYNEMKGVYSSFSSVALHNLISAMYPGSFASYDSGGDPLEITSLTYEQFCDFHQKFYNPDNCLLFLYGNIPTSDQLDFLNERFIPRIEKKYGSVNQTVARAANSLPLITDEIRELQTTARNKKSVSLKYTAPHTGAEGSMVTLNWYTGQNDLEKTFLSELLFGSDSSIFVRKLKESKLGTDVAPVCGNFGQFEDNFFSIGLIGVKKGNEEKVRNLILKTLEDVYNDGISRQEIDSAVMGIDFNLREETRSSGPFSLNLMSMTLASWSYGRPLSERLNPIHDFEKIKQKIASDPDYPKNLIKKFLIDNKQTVFVTVEPSKKFFIQRNKIERQLIKKLKKQTDIELLKAELEKLHNYQQKKETDKELSCIPHLSISNLSKKLPAIETQVTTVKNNEGKDIPLILNKEDTKGVVYVDVLLPVDSFNPEDFLDFSFFLCCLTNLGWNGKSWSDCVTQSGCLMGDVWATSFSKGIEDSAETVKNCLALKKLNLCNRPYLSISCKFLAEKTEPSLKMLSEIVSKMDFEDLNHFENMMTEYVADKKLSFISQGIYYAIRRAKSFFNVSCAIGELTKGFTQLNHCKSYTKKNAPELLKKFKKMYADAFAGGSAVHITADSKSMEQLLPLVQPFVCSAGLRPLSDSKPLELKNIVPFIYKADSSEISTEICKVPAQTGYCGIVFPCAHWCTKEGASDVVFANWLSMNSLWEKMRTMGGAYGAYSSADTSSKLCSVYTYRDPNPQNTASLFMKILEEDSKKLLSDEEIECAILSCYAEEIIPDSPSQRGLRGLRRTLYGTSSELAEKNLELILKVTPQDVRESAERLLENAKKTRKQVVICDNSKNCYGNLVDIGL